MPDHSPYPVFDQPSADLPRPDKVLPGGVLVLFDQASQRLSRGRLPAAKAVAAERLYCLGYPTLHPPAEALTRVAGELGVAVQPWPVPLSSTLHQEAWVWAAKKARQISRMAERYVAETRWVRLKANDRVAHRIVPWALIEHKILDLNALQPVLGIWFSWLAPLYDLVERSGMLSLDAPGHQAVPTARRLEQKTSLPVREVWPRPRRRERFQIVASQASMAAARWVILSGRAATKIRTPAPAPVSSHRPGLGIVIGGASCWYHLQHFAKRCAERFSVQIGGFDILRNPSAIRTLKSEKISHTSLPTVPPWPTTFQTLWRSSVGMWRQRYSLRRRAGRGVTPEQREDLLLLSEDVACKCEIDSFILQLRYFIRRHQLRAVVTANCLDAYLGGATDACRAEGIPHICIQNAPFERIDQPAFADAHLYVAESERFADFMRACGVLGRVEAPGLPYYDDLLQAKAQTAPGVIRQQFPELRDKRIIGVMTEHAGWDFRPLLEPLITTAQKRDDVAIVMKLHPRAPADLYRDLATFLRERQLGGALHLVPLTSFMRDCEAVVSTVSTTIHWANILGLRPFAWIHGHFTAFMDEVDFMHPAITFRSLEVSAVVDAVQKHLDDPQQAAAWQQSRAEYFAKFISGADGHACDRIMDLIAEVAGL